ncbi:MAG: adenylate/guanylate cyclase domain-containing protein [Dehalococcoidia bacterium]|nr:adenylate/guanylate cyclase domain-containing protein [Dehalococcoidia bacterium]
MEPRIQYAKTSDGVDIAFWTLGEGMPLVHTPFTFGHIQMEWQFPDIRRWYERLAEKRRLVRYDIRGTGVSQREAPEFSLDSLLLDLDAVVDRAGIERFALLGIEHSGVAAIMYAARHPERVSHLLLWHVYARASEWAPSQRLQATRALIDKDWETYTETVAHVAFGWSEGEQARRFAALIRESVTPEMAMLGQRLLNEVDVTAFLPQVTQPTLVLHRRQAPWVHVDVARSLASQIPDARLALLEGESSEPYAGDTEAVLAAIDEFLGEGKEAAPERQPASPAVHTILFTDVEGSTAMTQRLGDAKAREVLREHERVVREALAGHGGSEVKTMGDGFMASFGSATKALECAIAMQRAFAERNASLPVHPVAKGDSPGREALEGAPPEGAASSAPTEAIQVRIGLNAGEPIAEDDPDGRGDLFGTAVIAAARIAAQAQGGEILASNVVRELVAGKGFLFSARGKTVLRGFDDPVEVYEVRWWPPSTELRTGFDSPSAGAAGGSG